MSKTAIAVGSEPYNIKGEIIPDILVRRVHSEEEPVSLMELTKFAFEIDIDDTGYQQMFLEAKGLI